ncbi:MAG: aminopeptidase [Myxococcaceae bacterium]|nr:aminopeptidase [Myxococcaceae bacterium]MCI0669570.1 aminopeptidase [Myxococcaceae bacterium]
MRRLLLALVPLLLGGCFQAHYLSQAATGQAQLLWGAKSIPDVLRRPDVSPRLRRILARVPDIKAYGRTKGLRPTRNYERYTDLHRRAAVWVVQGCAPLAFAPKTWDFPLVGRVPYLGFFDEAAARRHAKSLAEDEKLDVTVRTASAYSTLGWFDDPVLSTMIPEGEHALGALANTLLHESVHATVYVNGQSAFNESLASFVADRLTLVWLMRTFGEDARETRAWAAAEVRGERYTQALHRGYLELADVYASQRSDGEKRAEKERILGGLREELKLSAPLNNAVLAGYRTYDTGGPAFARLLEACGRSWPAFLRAVGSLRDTDFSAPMQESFDTVIDRLIARGCGTAPERSGDVRAAASHR